MLHGYAGCVDDAAAEEAVDTAEDAAEETGWLATDDTVDEAAEDTGCKIEHMNVSGYDAYT